MTTFALEHSATWPRHDLTAEDVAAAYDWLVDAGGSAVLDKFRKGPGSDPDAAVRLLVRVRGDAAVAWLTAVDLVARIAATVPDLRVWREGYPHEWSLAFKGELAWPYIEQLLDAAIAGASPPALPRGYTRIDRSRLVIVLWDLLVGCREDAAVAGA